VTAERFPMDGERIDRMMFESCGRVGRRQSRLTREAALAMAGCGASWRRYLAMVTGLGRLGSSVERSARGISRHRQAHGLKARQGVASSAIMARNELPFHSAEIGEWRPEQPAKGGESFARRIPWDRSAGPVPNAERAAEIVRGDSGGRCRIVSGRKGRGASRARSSTLA